FARADVNGQIFPLACLPKSVPVEFQKGFPGGTQGLATSVASIRVNEPDEPAKQQLATEVASP
ncbi:MAG: hypothetical protein KAV00_12920, partial [Phycisphaerae bacterium]|nr:hypothetical protein [Phycisphaerae bacterium]